MMKRYTLLALFLLVCLAGHAAAEGTIYSYAPIAGGASSFAITDDGTLWGWGVNDFGTTTGLFGEDPSGNYYSPNKIMERAVFVSVGAQFAAFAIDTDGALWGWGSTFFHMIPNASADSPLTKIMDDVVAVASGNAHCLALKEDHTLWGWGDNSYGQVGVPMPEGEQFIYEPQLVMEDVTAIWSHGYSSYALRSDGTLWGWGGDTPIDIGRAIEEPVQIMDGVRSFGATFNEVMAIKEDDSLWVMAGGSSRWDYPEPTKVMEDVASCGGDFVLKTDGSLWTCRWPSTTLVKAMDDVIYASTGYYDLLAVTESNELWRLNFSEEDPSEMTITKVMDHLMPLAEELLPHPSEAALQKRMLRRVLPAVALAAAVLCLAVVLVRVRHRRNRT